MTLQKILWPTDFSARSRQALEYIKSLTRRYEAEIHVLYVIEALSHAPDWAGDSGPDHADNMRAWHEMEAHTRLDQICIDFLEDCPYFVHHVAVGDPAREILNLIEKEHIDMVVMSTRSADSRHHLGSVAGKVIRDAPVPVVTVPPDVAKAPAA